MTMWGCMEPMSPYDSVGRCDPTGQYAVGMRRGRASQASGGGSSWDSTGSTQ